jgi:hypothetical protein
MGGVVYVCVCVLSTLQLYALLRFFTLLHTRLRSFDDTKRIPTRVFFYISNYRRSFRHTRVNRICVEILLCQTPRTMPSFAFWKAAKPAVDAKSAEQTSLLQSQPESPLPVSLDPGTRDAGAFTFEDMSRLSSTPLQRLRDLVTPSDVAETIGLTDADAALLDDDDVVARCSEELGPRDGMASSSPKEEKMWEVRRQELGLGCADAILEPTRQAPGPPEPKRVAPDCPVLALSRPEPSRPAPAYPVAAPLRQAPAPPSPASSLALRDNPTSKPPSPPQPKRLYRPTELNLSTITSSAARPQSELEKRFSLMRDSTTQVKAALRSPTQLLKQRLSTSSKKTASVEKEKTQAFVPPQPSLTGCILPGPGLFTSSSVRACTSTGRPAWWCKVDKLVVFDGVVDSVMQTRTSKGLSIARRRGDTEMIIIPMDCAHCQTMLNRTEWSYDIQVCRRSVCGECRARCKWEGEQEGKEEGSRRRADSMLQDEEVAEEEMARKMGIERGGATSPNESIGGIEERMRV